MVAGLQGCQSFSFFVRHCVSLEKGERDPCVTLGLLVASRVPWRAGGGCGDSTSFLFIWAKMQTDTLLLSMQR